jgi:hypothetical protein
VKIDLGIISMLAGFAFNAIVIIASLTNQFGDVKSDIALIQKDVQYLRIDVDNLKTERTARFEWFSVPR